MASAPIAAEIRRIEAMTDDDTRPQRASGEHCGIFTIPGEIPILGAYRDICYVPLRNRIWTASEGIYRTCFLEGKKGVVAFDTFGTPGTARAYAGAIHRVFPDKPVHTIVYSHDHLDHTGYPDELAADADIIAHDLCQQVVVARKSDGQKPATEVWNGERTEYETDGCRFELIYPGHTHGDGNVAAYFPEDKVLFMVDTVIPGVGYTTLMDWHLTHYVPVMKRFLSLDWDTFVPGHFWVLNREQFVDNLDYLDRMFEFGQRAILDGVDPHDWDDINRYANEKLGPLYGNLFRFGEYAAMNLSRYMQECLTGGWGIEGNLRPDTGPL
jgi:glyoxylase-like metal-dependent hydrolase (beta-lactamase superfamily II)